MKKYVLVMILMPWIVSASDWFMRCSSRWSRCTILAPDLGGIHSGLGVRGICAEPPDGRLFCQAKSSDEWPVSNKDWLQSCDKTAEKNDICTTYQVRPKNLKQTPLIGVCLPAPAGTLLCQSTKRWEDERQRRVEERKRQVEEWRKAKGIS